MYLKKYNKKWKQKLVYSNVDLLFYFAITCIYMYIKTIACFILSEIWICYIIFLKFPSAFGK